VFINFFIRQISKCAVFNFITDVKPSTIFSLKIFITENFNARHLKFSIFKKKTTAKIAQAGAQPGFC